MRDYDKDPIVIKNNYLLKREFPRIILLSCLFLFFAYRMYFHGIPDAIAENNMIHLREWQGGLIAGITEIIIFLVMAMKVIKKFIQNHLYRKNYNDKITYDYLNEQNKFKTFTLFKKDIKSIKWGFYPYAILNEKDEIWITETTDDKFGTYLFLPLQLILSIIYLMAYCIANFKLEKYILTRFKGGIIAIPKKDYLSNENIKFEWRSLFNCQMLQGGYYGK